MYDIRQMLHACDVAYTHCSPEDTLVLSCQQLASSFKLRNLQRCCAWRDGCHPTLGVNSGNIHFFCAECIPNYLIQLHTMLESKSWKDSDVNLDNLTVRHDVSIVAGLSASVLPTYENLNRLTSIDLMTWQNQLSWRQSTNSLEGNLQIFHPPQHATHHFFMWILYSVFRYTHTNRYPCRNKTWKLSCSSSFYVWLWYLYLDCILLVLAQWLHHVRWLAEGLGCLKIMHQSDVPVTFLLEWTHSGLITVKITWSPHKLRSLASVFRVQVVS